MSKLHWNQAPERVRRRIDLARLEHGQFAGMQMAYVMGYDWPPEDVLTPALDRLREIEATGDRVMIASARASMSVELAEERRCVVKANSMRPWSLLPNAEEAAAVAAAERERATKEQAIEHRTREALASEKIKHEASVRARITKELS